MIKILDRIKKLETKVKLIEENSIDNDEHFQLKFNRLVDEIVDIVDKMNIIIKRLNELK